MDIRPNHTIYINRLNEKVKKEGKYGFVANHVRGKRHQLCLCLSYTDCSVSV